MTDLNAKTKKYKTNYQHNKNQKITRSKYKSLF